jgi:hypothetical protein
MITITGKDELAAGSGYSQYGVEVTGKTVTENDTNDRMDFGCADIVFTASGGSIGPTPGAVLYDDSAADKTVVGYLGFGKNQTIADGNSLTLKNVKIQNA